MTELEKKRFLIEQLAVRISSGPVLYFHNGVFLFFNPFTANGHFHKQSTRWPTFLMLFQILKEGVGLSLLDELEVRYHVIKK